MRVYDFSLNSMGEPTGVDSAMCVRADILEKLGVDFEITVISAHREPDIFFQYAKSLEAKGVKVVIAGAGKAAHLPGMCAALFPMPVIGIPMKTSDLGGVDLQLLGLGHNGHIGFNEPAQAFEKTTHCVDLTESTIEANKRFFASIDDVPKQAYTMGIQTIMKAKKILLLVSGEDKAAILRDALCGPVTPQVPASILQLHNDVIVVADEAALSKMPK